MSECKNKVGVWQDKECDHLRAQIAEQAAEIERGKALMVGLQEDLDEEKARHKYTQEKLDCRTKWAISLPNGDSVTCSKVIYDAYNAILEKVRGE